MAKVTRDHWLRVRLTQRESDMLDKARGPHSRSSYVRLLLRKAASK